MILSFRASSQIVLVNDSFSDLEARIDAPPNSLLWQYGAYNPVPSYGYATIEAGSGSMIVDHTNPVSNSVAFWGHFRPSGQPMTLAPGDTLRFEFDIRFSGGSFGSGEETFHFSLFNSNASRLQPFVGGFRQNSNPYIASSQTFTPWQGYEGLLPLNTQGDFFLQKRTGSDVGLHDPALWTAFPDSHIQEPLFAADTFYHGYLSLARSPDGSTMSLRAGINNVETPMVQDAVMPFVSFDTVEFFAAADVSHDIIVDNVQVTQVPESSIGVFTLLAVGLSAGRVRVRRGAANPVGPAPPHTSLHLTRALGIHRELPANSRGK